MSCVSYISALEPTIIKWNCHECGKEVKIDNMDSLKEHYLCSVERNFGNGNREYIPVDYEIPFGELTSL